MLKLGLRVQDDSALSRVADYAFKQTGLLHELKTLAFHAEPSSRHGMSQLTDFHDGLGADYPTDVLAIFHHVLQKYVNEELW